MKKALVLTIALIILSISGMAFAFADINAARDQVVLTKNVKYGDDSAVEKLEVHVRTHYDYHLFWDTVYQTDKESVQTNFLFSHAQAYDNPPMEYSGAQMEIDIEYGFGPILGNKQQSIKAAYNELIDRTPAGTEGSATIRLKDYYDFYPFMFTLDVPGYTLTWGSDFSTNFTPEPGTETYIILEFLNFFRIPVIDDQTIDIYVTKSADGSIGGYGRGDTDSDAFYIWTLSALTDQACYFTFNTHTKNGNVVDTSFIPGGYGIYNFPYKENGVPKDGMNPSGILFGELSMVYSLNPEDRVFDLNTNPDKTKLLLLTEENKVCVLTVIDIETMKPLQRLELAELGEDESVWNVFYYDDFFTILLPDNRMILLDVDKDGEYVHRFTVNLYDEENKLFLPSYIAAMDWNGEKLVLSDFLYNSYDWDNRDYPKYCGFYLAVYDETGLLFYGEYLSSLDAGNDLNNHINSCRRMDHSPLAVRWMD